MTISCGSASGLDVAVDEAGWDVEEAALLDDGVLAALGAELEPSAAADDVSEGLAVAVVVPARGDAAIGADPVGSIPFSVSKASSRVSGRESSPRPGVRRAQRS